MPPSPPVRPLTFQQNSEAWAKKGLNCEVEAGQARKYCEGVLVEHLLHATAANSEA